MSTPEENFQIATDESSDGEARVDAIETLQTANECTRLAKLARMDDLGERYRERALEALADPQCERKLRSVADGDDLPESLRERAETLLEDTPEEAGAGPS